MYGSIPSISHLYVDFSDTTHSCHRNLPELLGVLIEVEVETEEALIVTNPDPVEMSNRPIQPQPQRSDGQSRSNDDVLVCDSRDDTGVSCIVEPLEKKEVKVTYRKTKTGELLCISCDNNNEHDGRSMNVVWS